MTDTTNGCTGGLAPQRRFVQASTVRLSYLEWGTAGPPLLLLHGITSSARTMWRVAPALVERGYHVYALDMPGHGESDETDDHRIESIAALVSAAVRALDIQGAVLIGHSWGGATALALAASPVSPPLARVVLVDPAMSMSLNRGTDALPNFLSGLGQPPEQTLPAVRAANPSWHPCDYFWKGEALQQCRPAAVRGLFLGSGEWDLIGRLSHVHVPLLLLVADPQRTIIPPEAIPLIKWALRPGLGQLVGVPGTDHNMLRGGFDATMPIILEWLGEPGR